MLVKNNTGGDGQIGAGLDRRADEEADWWRFLVAGGRRWEHHGVVAGRKQEAGKRGKRE